jgi:outer membrane protein TolC
MALRENKAIRSQTEQVRAAEARVGEAHGGRLPTLNYTESFTRSDNPVFVFSSLLSQHQFGEQNFAIGPLNRPDPLNNFQSQLTLDQTIYDGGRNRSAERAADLGRGISEEESRRARMETIAAAARAYYDAILGGESLKTAEQAVRSAEADLRRAEAVRSAGMSTDADVLSIRVHLAAVDEHRIQQAADLDVARATLNDALGLPLGTAHELSTRLTVAPAPELTVDELERTAAHERPETREARITTNLAQTHADRAHAALLPQVSLHAVYEADREYFVTRGGASWLAGVSLRWNIFNGLSDKSRIAEAGHGILQAEAEGERTDSAVRLQVRRAFAYLRAARQRIEVAQAAVAEAEESLRITQNRYEAGMSNVTDLLRNETAVLESRTRYLAAVHDQRVAAVMLELAAGRLSPDSEVLQ